MKATTVHKGDDRSEKRRRPFIKATTVRKGDDRLRDGNQCNADPKQAPSSADAEWLPGPVLRPRFRKTASTHGRERAPVKFVLEDALRTFSMDPPVFLRDLSPIHETREHRT
ncbi:hypothetical protein Bbelb_164720 [Branchiostoma belcheri]|nr:hypothetical protein Bbelb_164720 [Branchiostoma belcheri]